MEKFISTPKQKTTFNRKKEGVNHKVVQEAKKAAAATTTTTSEIKEIILEVKPEISTGISVVVSLPYKVILHELLGRLFLSPPVYDCVSVMDHHGFMGKIEFKVGQEKIALNSKIANTRKDAEEDAALQALLHLQKRFAIVFSPDVDSRNLLTHVQASYSYEELKGKYEDAVDKLLHMKVAFHDHLDNIQNVQEQAKKVVIDSKLP